MLCFEKKNYTKQVRYYKINFVDSNKIFFNLNEFASLHILKGAFCLIKIRLCLKLIKTTFGKHFICATVSI